MQALRRSGNPEFAKIEQLLAESRALAQFSPLGFGAMTLRLMNFNLATFSCRWSLRDFPRWFDVTKLDVQTVGIEVAKTRQAQFRQIGVILTQHLVAEQFAKGDGGQSQSGTGMTRIMLKRYLLTNLVAAGQAIGAHQRGV